MQQTRLPRNGASQLSDPHHPPCRPPPSPPSPPCLKRLSHSRELSGGSRGFKRENEPTPASEGKRDRHWFDSIWIDSTPPPQRRESVLLRLCLVCPALHKGTRLEFTNQTHTLSTTGLEESRGPTLSLSLSLSCTHGPPKRRAAPGLSLSLSLSRTSLHPLSPSPEC